MWTRSELKERGKLAFKANYWKCVLVAFVMSIITAAQSSSSRESDSSESLADAANSVGINPLVLISIVVGAIGIGVIIALALEIFVKNIIKVGCSNFFLANSDDPEARAEIMFGGFKEGFKNKAIVMLMQDIFLFLWTLLLIIPGIVKSYEYRMIPYIIAENPDMEWKEVFAISKKMMTGQKWNAFVLDLSFLGWHILSIFTLGILNIFYVAPYVYATDAELYKVLKENN